MAEGQILWVDLGVGWHGEGKGEKHRADQSLVAPFVAQTLVSAASRLVSTLFGVVRKSRQPREHHIPVRSHTTSGV